MGELHQQQLTNESVAAKAFEVRRDTKLHEWVSDPIETQNGRALKSAILGRAAGKRSNILPPNSLVVQLHFTFENFASSLHETRNRLQA